MDRDFVESRDGSFYLTGSRAASPPHIAERRRVKDAYGAVHPTPPDIKEKFERMRRQMLARRS